MFKKIKYWKECRGVVGVRMNLFNPKTILCTVVWQFGVSIHFTETLSKSSYKPFFTIAIYWHVNRSPHKTLWWHHTKQKENTDFCTNRACINQIITTEKTHAPYCHDKDSKISICISFGCKIEEKFRFWPKPLK